MKIAFLLVFLFSIPGISAQEVFNQETMFRNKVEKVSVYSRVPKTNPEYYNEPKGFMHISDHYFNEAGQETNSICYNCSCASHSGCKDSVKTFRYEDDKLISMHATGLDTITVSYLYFPVKSCHLEITTDNKGERIELCIVYDGLLGRESSRAEVSFRGVSATNHFVDIIIEKTLFSGRTEKTMLKNNLYSVTLEQIAMLRSSSNLAALEDCIKEIEKQMSVHDINPKEFVATYLMEYDAEGNLIKNYYNPDSPERNDVETYEYDENGLLIKSAHYFMVFTDRKEYRYSFRK